MRRSSGYPTITFFVSMLLVLGGCDDTPIGDEDAREFTFTFEEGAEGWIGDFADYPTSKTAEDMDLVFDRAALPEDVDESSEGLFLSGRNESDDLFMYIRREISGLEPNTPYAVRFLLRIASNAPSGCVGIGGPPGEAVRVKVGAAVEEPVPVVRDDHYRLSVEKDDPEGTTSQSTFREIGNVANGLEQCTGDVPYRMITLGNVDDPLLVTTNSTGSLWLFVGTDSGFEGTTSLYYDTVAVTIARR